MTALLIEQDCRQWPLWQNAHLCVRFLAADRYKRDLDNLIASIKPYIDALVGINGVIEDDSADRLTFRADYKRVPKSEQTRMEFVITHMSYDVPNFIGGKSPVYVEVDEEG